MMQTYRVVWEIDIEAGSAEEAAREALEIQRRQPSDATFFNVFDEDEDQTDVDLGYV